MSGRGWSVGAYGYDVLPRSRSQTCAFTSSVWETSRQCAEPVRVSCRAGCGRHHFGIHPDILASARASAMQVVGLQRGLALCQRAQRLQRELESALVAAHADVVADVCRVASSNCCHGRPAAAGRWAPDCARTASSSGVRSRAACDVARMRCTTPSPAICPSTAAPEIPR